MKRKFLTLISACVLSAGLCEGHSMGDASLSTTGAGHYHVINTDEVKDILYSGQEVVVVDARTKEYDDGVRLPGAILLPHTSTSDEIKAVLPGLDETIIVYCTGKKCPASGKLVDRLVAMGYTNVWKYADGLEAWIKSGGKTEKAK